MLVRMCTRGPCPTPRVSIMLMRYIPARGRAKVRIYISGKDAGGAGTGRRQGRETEKCCISWVRAVYAHIYRRVHKLSSHYRSPRNTLYACKTAKTNAVPTARMLRRRLYAWGPRGPRYSRPQVLYVWRVINETRTALSTGRGLSRRRPPSTVPLRGSRRFRSPSVINSPTAARRLHSFSTSVIRTRINLVWFGQMKIVTMHFIFL